MKFTEDQIRLIHEGIDAFNERRYDDAHAHWECVWKELRKTDIRNCLKALIQLSGSYLNCSLKKKDASLYLLKRAKVNTIKYELELKQFIESNILISDIDVLLKKKLTVKVFHQLQIKKAG